MKSNPEKRREDEKSVLDCLSRGGKMYAVEVAGSLGMIYSKTKSILMCLERIGKVESCLEESSPGGSIRRYYRIKKN